MVYDILAAPRSISAEVKDQITADMFHVVQLAKSSTNDDRTVAIVTTAYLENVLTETIAVRLPVLDQEVRTTLFDPQRNAPLSTFAAKVHMARALHIVDGVPYEDLKLIGRIRNEFAHKVRVVSFEASEVQRHISKLRAQDRAYAIHKPTWADESARGRFVHSAENLSVGLLNTSITDAGFGAACLR